MTKPVPRSPSDRLDSNDAAHQSQAVEFHDIIAPVDTEIKAVDRLIQASLSSDVPLIAEINAYLINSGGKRLRPLVALLCGNALGCFNDLRQHQLATAIEFLHNATLLHDDVVDDSTLRRGRKTTHTVWGNATSILVGDFLISRSLQLLTQINSMPVLHVFAETTNLIAEGEVMQLQHCKNPDTSLAQYREVIRRKTAAMFEAAARGAAMIANGSPATIDALSSYALHLGNAFQMIDDALDYNSSTELMGKNSGDDLSEGKVTLPLLFALQHASTDDAAFLRRFLRNADTQKCDNATLSRGIEIVRANGGVTETQRLATLEIQNALTSLESVPTNPSTTSLKLLAQFTLQRKS